MGIRGSKPVGLVLPLSSASEGAAGRTGVWRTERPVIDYDRCTSCLMCWLYCPEAVIERVDVGGKEMVTIDYTYCKGCGVCADVCPVNAIVMVREV